MKTKTLKIEVPKGYEIDKEKSTFENIVFKKVDDVVIKWNKNYNGVEIKAGGEHFVISADPSYYMSWVEAERFYDERCWDLPIVKQLQVVYKYFDKINEVIEDNNGFILYKSNYWSIEERSNSFAMIIYMYNGNINDMCKCNYNFVRAVSTL